MEAVQLFPPQISSAGDLGFIILSILTSIFLVAFVYYLYVTPGEMELKDNPLPLVETSPLLLDPPKSKHHGPVGFYTEQKTRLVYETTEEQHRPLYFSPCRKPCYLICYCGAKRGTKDAIQGWLQGSEVSGCPRCGKMMFRNGAKGTCQCWQGLLTEEEEEMIEPGNMV